MIFIHCKSAAIKLIVERIFRVFWFCCEGKLLQYEATGAIKTQSQTKLLLTGASARRGGRRRRKMMNQAGYFKLRTRLGTNLPKKQDRGSWKTQQVLNSLSWTLPGADQSAADYTVKLSTKGGDFFRFQVYERVVILKVAVRTKE